MLRKFLIGFFIFAIAVQLLAGQWLFAGLAFSNLVCVWES